MAKGKTNSDLVYVVCACLRVMVSNTYCVVFLFFFSSSCIHYVASFSALYIFDCPFCVLSRLLSTKHCRKSKDCATRAQQKTGCELRCSGRARSSDSTGDTRYLNRPMICWIFNVIGGAVIYMCVRGIIFCLCFSDN